MVQATLAAWLKKPQAKNEGVAPPTVKKSAAASPPPVVDQENEHGLDHEHEHGGQHDDEDDATEVTTTSSKSLVLPKAKLPPNVTLASITADTLPSFRRMTTLLLPVPYPDKFYNDILTDSVAASISMIALWTDTSNPTINTKPRVVAGVRCRLVSHPTATDSAASLYISTVTTLAPFRGHGLARALLRRITARAIRDYDICTVTAHMWEENEDARQWYEKMGFRKLNYDPNYYRKLKPGGAYLFERRVGPGDLLVEQDEDD